MPRFALALTLLVALAATARGADLPVRTANDQVYLSRLWALLEGAQRSVDVVALTFHGNRPLIRLLQDRLVALAAAGVRVRILMDGREEWSRPENEATRDRLGKLPNVRVKLASTAKTLHTKLVVVDGRRALVGSSNLTDNSLLNNAEANVLVDDEATAAAFGAYVDLLWEGSDRDCNVDRLVLDGRVRVVTDRAYQAHVAALLRGATRSVDVLLYTIWYQPARTELGVTDLCEALLAARARGLRTTLYLDGAGASEGVRASNAATAELFAARGLPVRFVRADGFVHSKVIVVDAETVVVSSFNWGSDVDRNHNAGVIVRDRALASRYLRYLVQVANP